MSSSLRTRSGGRSLVSLLLALVMWPAVLPAQETGLQGSQAEGVLASRGLRRIGNLYLLEAEITAREDSARDRVAVQRLQAEAASVQRAGQLAEQQLGGMTRQVQDLQVRRDELIRLDQQLINRGDPADALQIEGIRAEIRNLQDQINQLGTSRALVESELRRHSQQLEQVRADLFQRDAEARRRAQDLAFAYTRLAGDSQVFKALKELNRTANPWVMIGPESEYNTRVGQLARSILADAGLQLDPRQLQISVVAEKEVKDLGHRAWILQQKLLGQPEAAERQEMAQVVDQLRRRIEEVQGIYAKLPLDPLIAAAIEQCNLALPRGKRFRIAPTADFVKEVKRLPEFEGMLAQKP